MDSLITHILSSLDDNHLMPEKQLPENTDFKALVENILGEEYKLKDADWKDIYYNLILGRRKLLTSFNLNTIKFAMMIHKGDPTPLAEEALAYAGKNGNADTVKYLLAFKKISKKVKSKAFLIACHSNSLSVVRIFLGLPDANEFVNNHKALVFASDGGSVPILELLHNVYKVEVKCPEGIYLGCKNGFLDVVKYWHKNGEILNRNNNELLRIATKGCRDDVIMYLLEDKSVDPTIDSNTLFCWAACNNKPNVIKHLLSDTRIDVKSLTPYICTWICCTNNVDTLKLCIEDGRINIAYDKCKILRKAVKNNQVECVKVLIEDSRIDVNAKNGYALNVAKELEHEEIVKLLE